ncbi:branched-chain amino acid transport system ATP-binding protein [Nocardioides sp. BE266]|uniref:ABC transporter ATP-binding protein n=1 Tax=Nocardioides sp. BE266 TaxID=2817725 RepID=UPI0028629192|nr:ABC transporter ATP-binding protein [Nocardioides sp. BE266]MDR7254572.1 branched-chain amino acid transport system ATP-binding protein [Nocardioides sp. BE266]
MLLELNEAVLNYGKIQALHGISVQVNEGEVVSLIGANGAGKTSTMRALSGVRGLASGTVVFDGEDVTKLRADQRLRKGLVLCPEGRGIFPGMTVTENLNMGAYTRKDKAAIDEDYDRVFGLFPRLLERKKQVAGTMSGGEQQMLAIGRALMSRPKLLMLDEPSMGLAPMLIQQIFDIITEISQQGTTILVVEQNAKQALSRSDRAYVLETGKIVKTGTGTELLDDPSVREAYLGVA